MTISLRPIDIHNYEAVCDLDVADTQQNYVACNMWSLVEAQFNQGYTTRAIYRNEEVVGFFMWVAQTGHSVSIWRFMIDLKFQQQGIGREALSLALEQIKSLTDVKQIEICYMPSNPVAKAFYSSFGFQEVGMDDEGEDMLAVIELSQ
ncbi:GNAT family N-acetyltransferase [Pseudoalteromonas sp. MMG013]|uniref:Diamine N-acetyltransferase n=1 Tax=Pseudoalteromonas aurantia 208 TaxID=1314867 RepID=A0ABR9EDD6_9GAMM|nr:MULTISPECIES: GNAT family N-acetyltransferase [Pseudoalteromonas]MBE0368374.1 diamine N-acetyltransferase [Pseudoalteromonas aurantia 208]MBQ4848378.1 GNAT family N-acetyltransferase [Pseudoalteromonas sp. MMG005]MBQ4864205.1 GNAT family N-acetyltransferase [Pseudoalteromonas sp. MMG013]